jgi:quercetin dioxygenase-like cupin family protein
MPDGTEITVERRPTRRVEAPVPGYLASGSRVALRLWDDEEPSERSEVLSHEYETVGFVLAGRAELTLGGISVTLEPGDSWVVPNGAEHRYRILEPFTAVEAVSPPARIPDGSD